MNHILKKDNIYRLYAVTDRDVLKGRSIYDAVFECLVGGATIIQLREKDMAEDAFICEAIKIKELCSKFNVPLIINDNVNVMEKSNADGIHVGQSDMNAKMLRERIGKDKILGVSAHNIEEAKEALENGADYLGVGAMFKTSTKDDASIVDIKTLKDITKNVSLPVVVIGGIKEGNIKDFKDANIDGFAIVSDIFSSQDIIEKTRAIDSKIDEVIPKVRIKSVLTIAGSDSSGGAGIQADIKTISAHKLYASSAITALTAQNTLGVESIFNVDPNFLKSELEMIFNDIYPDSIKIGMLSEAPLIEVIGDTLKRYKAKNIVLDPVMVSTSGYKLLNDNAIKTLISRLFPLASLITPNVPEAEILSGISIKCEDDFINAAKIISKYTNGAILIKGGHSINDANDLLYMNDTYSWIKSERILNDNTHGTGCTLSSAIASNLALGNDLYNSVKKAKNYLTSILKYKLDLGHGSGPLAHMEGEIK